MSVIDAIRLDDPSFLLPSPRIEFAALRAESPVCYDPRTDAWLVARYEDVSFVLRHPEIFVSGLGVSPEERAAPGAEPVHGEDFMLATDATRHSELRATVQPGYTGSRLTSAEGRLRTLIAPLVAQLAADEPFDAYATLAKKVAIGSVCAFLGVPDEDVAWVDQASTTWRPGDSPWSGERPDDYPEGSLERYFARLLELRAAQPTDDVLSIVAGTRGSALSLRARLMLCIDLVVAGNEPTAAGISGGLRALAEHAEAYARLTTEPELIPTAINELLRWVSPVPYMCRTAVQDVEVGGQLVPAGSFVYLLYASANQDEQMWGNPEVLDVTRKEAAKHLSFGKGTHTCIGAGLVRQVFRILLEELTARFREITVAGTVQIVAGVHMPHLGHLPIVGTLQPTSPSAAREA